MLVRVRVRVRPGITSKHTPGIHWSGLGLANLSAHARNRIVVPSNNMK